MRKAETQTPHKEFVEGNLFKVKLHKNEPNFPSYLDNNEK